MEYSSGVTNLQWLRPGFPVPSASKINVRMKWAYDIKVVNIKQCWPLVSKILNNPCSHGGDVKSVDKGSEYIYNGKRSAFLLIYWKQEPHFMILIL